MLEWQRSSCFSCRLEITSGLLKMDKNLTQCNSTQVCHAPVMVLSVLFSEKVRSEGVSSSCAPDHHHPRHRLPLKGGHAVVGLFLPCSWVSYQVPEFSRHSWSGLVVLFFCLHKYFCILAVPCFIRYRIGLHFGLRNSLSAIIVEVTLASTAYSDCSGQNTLHGLHAVQQRRD